MNELEKARDFLIRNGFSGRGADALSAYTDIRVREVLERCFQMKREMGFPGDSWEEAIRKEFGKRPPRRRL